MKRKSLIDLPEVFVEFAAEKLVGCAVVYLNQSLAESKTAEEVLDTYSYVVRSNASNCNDKPSIKTFLAERYGGDGILSNGGGGRCGFDGQWQLKGVGPNELVGKDVDAEHGDGNLCLQTALYETTWAEIIHTALPFGAVRTVSILDTGIKYETLQETKARALLVRNPAVRPAHFIRAIYYKEKRTENLNGDSRRVKLAIARLVEFLPAADPTVKSQCVRGRLALGLHELAGRFAKQFAAARSKGIAHCNVSASNLSLDGAWLDLSGAKLVVLEDARDKFSIDRLHTEHHVAIESLQHLCYYLSKYCVLPPEESAAICQQITEHFFRSYALQLSIYQVAQAGFPLWILQKITDSAEFSDFSSQLNRTLEKIFFLARPISCKSGWRGYEYWAARLYAALLASKVHSSAIEVNWLNADAQVIAHLASSFSRLFDLAARKAREDGIKLKNFHRAMAINMTRLNRIHNKLHKLDILIAEITKQPQKERFAQYEDLTNSATHAAKLNLYNEPDSPVPFWFSETLSITFEPTIGMFTAPALNSRPLSTKALIETGFNRDDVRIALYFYRDILDYLHE
jgi:hypothetical protein